HVYRAGSGVTHPGAPAPPDRARPRGHGACSARRVPPCSHARGRHGARRAPRGRGAVRARATALARTRAADLARGRRRGAEARARPRRARRAAGAGQRRGPRLPARPHARRRPRARALRALRAGRAGGDRRAGRGARAHPARSGLFPEKGRALAATPPVASTAGTLKQANVAIDTDQELRAKFATDSAALDYLASLAAAATSIYERDVAVRLRFSYIRLWGAAPPDPWSATAPGGALGEVRTYWNDPANKMDTTAGPRTVVHFVSGKSVQGGVAYLDVLCNASYGYGVSQVYGSFDLSQPSQIWDALVVTHELGHNFG